MRHSIKARFAMIFVGLMAFVLIATWCVNNWFLESFYTMDKVATLEKAYNGIDRIVTETEIKGTAGTVTAGNAVLHQTAATATAQVPAVARPSLIRKFGRCFSGII